MQSISTIGLDIAKSVFQSSTPCSGSFNSPDIHGTHVPVEEPTAR